MKSRGLGAVAAAATLALTLAACGSSDDGGSGGSTGAEGGTKLKVGIKFDQPGMGLKKGSEYTGMDVDVAKYIAKELGAGEGDITWVQAPSAQRETLIQTGQVDMIVATYSITDTRKEKVELRRPLLHRRPGPAHPCRRRVDHGARLPRRQEALLRQGLDLGPEGQGQVPRSPAPGVRHLLGVPAGPLHGWRRRADDRRHDPRRVCRPAGVQGQVQGRRPAVLRGELRRRHQEG